MVGVDLRQRKGCFDGEAEETEEVVVGAGGGGGGADEEVEG